MRGKRINIHSSRLKPGITPAGAGKTSLYVSSARSHKDHPRRCGENFIKPFLRFQEAGSPPQVRGKRSRCAGRKRSGRITPAGAGKTAVKVAALDIRQDHPRRCGENVKRGFFQFIMLGITPAGAGKTLQSNVLTDFFTDHPRRCGENDRRNTVE